MDLWRFGPTMPVEPQNRRLNCSMLWQHIPRMRGGDQVGAGTYGVQVNHLSPGDVEGAIPVGCCRAAGSVDLDALAQHLSGLLVQSAVSP